MTGRVSLGPALAVLLPLAVLTAVAGNELVLALGVVANPGIAGVLAGMALARLPGALFRPFAAPPMQALAQAVATAASMGAGQALLLPASIPFALGRPDLVGPMFLGAFLALLVDGWLMWRLFATPSFPADAPWPPGIAAAALIHAGPGRDHPRAMLLAGMVVGAFGALNRAPMAGFGVALLGNAWALSLFTAGVLLRAHGAPLLGWLGPGGDLMQAQLPQGMLAGAAVVALGQMLFLSRAAPRVLSRAAAAHLAIAMLLAFAGGLHAGMTAAMLAQFVLFAAGAALLHALVVGVTAMHAGWLPNLAAALVVLAGGRLIGFPPAALALLVGLSAATGPGFAAMGQALRTAHGIGGDAPALRQQALAVMLAFAVAAAVAWLSLGPYFAADRIPPAAHVFAVAIRAGIAPGVMEKMAPWVLAGAALQLAGGPRRHLGLMLAAGMLLLAPAVGWAILMGLLLRALVLAIRREDTYRNALQQFGAGIIAGDALVALYFSLDRTLARR